MSHSISFTHILSYKIDVKCNKCGASLEIVSEDEEGDADVTLLVVPHECETRSWTREIPHVDGYYWRRVDGDDSNLHIIEVINGDLYETGSEAEVRSMIDVSGWEFLGPVAPPHECLEANEQPTN